MCTQKENSCYYLNLIHIPEHELRRVLFGWYKTYAIALGMLQFEPLFKYITAVYLRNTVKFISNITYTNKTTENG